MTGDPPDPTEPTEDSPEVADPSAQGGLPPRTDAGEERFVARWRDHADADTQTLLDAVHAAVDARRWMLAARLVSLVPVREGEPEALALARRAAGLVVVHKLRPEDVSWSAIPRIWAQRQHVARMARARRRWESALGLPPGSRRGGGRGRR